MLLICFFFIFILKHWRCTSTNNIYEDTFIWNEIVDIYIMLYLRVYVRNITQVCRSLLVIHITTFFGSHWLRARHIVPYLPFTRLGIRELPRPKIFSTSPKLISVGLISSVDCLYLWWFCLRLNSGRNKNS